MGMLRNRLYYGIKPLLPRSIRMGLRSWLARRTREPAHDVWPIPRGSERPPDGWPGWPHGKQFALILTHDVEGIRGIENLDTLVELELKMGFRSAINFIPEGEYPVCPVLVHKLRAQGFEIGVHDLRHDGKLYQNRE